MLRKRRNLTKAAEAIDCNSVMGGRISEKEENYGMVFKGLDDFLPARIKTMRKYIAFISVSFLCMLASCSSVPARDFSYKDISVDLQVADQKEDVELLLVISNCTNHPVTIPNSYIPSNERMVGLFYIWEQYAFLVRHERKYVTYKGNADYRDLPDDKACTVLPAGKNLQARIRLNDFYEIPDDMNTLLFVTYEGYLGESPMRTIDLCSPSGKHYFDVSLDARNTDDGPVAEISYKNISGKDLFLPKYAFVDGNLMYSDSLLITDAQGKEREYTGIVGDRFGISPFYGECIRIKKNETYVTTVVLASFYDIEGCSALSVAIRYSSSFGKSNTAYIVLDE